MADTKTTSLSELTTTDPATDVIMAVDVSDTTLGAGGTNKGVRIVNLFPPQTANTIYSGPSSAGPSTATFRALVAADVPSLAASKITTGQMALARGGTGADLSATGGTGQVLKQTSGGGVVTVAAISTSDLPTTGLTIQSWSTALTTATDGGTVTFDLGASSFQQVTLAGNRTLALSNATSASRFTLILKQDATGSRTVAWFAGITWATDGNATPTLTTTANKRDVFTFLTVGSGAYLGFVAGQSL